jgi:thermitase
MEGIMLAAVKLSNWGFKTANLAWSMAVLGSAGAGLFLGLGQPAHSDISKYSALLSQHERVPGEVIVKLSPSGKAGLRAQGMNALLDTSRFGISAIEKFETNDSYYLVKLSNDVQTAEFLTVTNENKDVEFAEPNYVLHALGERDEEEQMPNDVDFNKLWGLKNVGQKDSGGVDGLAGADIDAAKAWTITKGNKAIIVGVIDTGVDYTHPDLAANIYRNPGENGDGKQTNGIDDDANGFVDDHVGWNFAGVSTNNPMDDNEHGTHVSGTIAGSGNNGVGVAGVNWEGSVLPIKFLTGSGSGTLADAVKAIQYSVLMNVHMTNNSWGGGGFTQSMFDAIKSARDKGQLFIAAAGNSAQNSDSRPHYPAGYQLENVIAVAATTNLDTLASFSTYGKRTVHIAAPGHKIYSTVPNGGYDSFSGTSMASPHVAGAAALLWGTDPTMTYDVVKDRLLRSRDFIGGLSRKVQTSGRLNINNAIRGIYPPSPEPQESDWKDMSLPAPIESEHPYKASQTQEWTLEGPANAKYVRVVFSKIELEDNYDFVRVIDASGVEVDKLSGKSENAASFYANGNKITLKFTSDSSDNRWGFAVAKVQFVE